ncbi:MAG: FG-GAP-like repeat-containing protein, partial [Caldilinea sp.]
MAQEGVQAVDTLNREEEIVYIDADGYIRVYDPQTPNNLPPVVFRSPDAGWYDATVGDVNGDGDDEILAFAENGLLKIYDPVVTTT